jgi:23S rRNA (adenine2503-C2)-methyltransferase
MVQKIDTPADPRPALLDLSPDELKALLTSWGQPAFRAGQIYQHLWVRLADSVDAMTDLPAALREQLARETRIGGLTLKVVKSGDDGLTRKAVWTLRGGETIESVLMIYPDRATVCVSSQAGCPMGCVFCATAKLGFLKDLTGGEIAQQVLWAARELKRIGAANDYDPRSRHKVDASNFPKHLSNVVFMGMGEPFNNYDNWWNSIEKLHDPKGFNMGARSFTVSTVGLIPGIQRLMQSGMQVNLAISLHAVDDEARVAMMPVNKRYPIGDLLDAVEEFTRVTGRRVSFEYVLLDHQNDSPAEAEKLAGLLRSRKGLVSHVNLIPWNPVRDTGLSRSTRDRINQFRDILENRGVPATIRIQRGVDIDAACGQLAGDLAQPHAAPPA